MSKEKEDIKKEEKPQNKFYKKYNDYELLYLYRNDHLQKAYDELFNKYDSLIYKRTTEIYPYGDKMMDLVQEGRMVLASCITNYKEDGGASFFTYFDTCLKRRIYNLVGKDHYYDPYLHLLEPDDIALYDGDISKVTLHKGHRYFKSPLKSKMFDCCIMDGMTITEFAIQNEIKYSRAYAMYNEIIAALKKTFSID